MNVWKVILATLVIYTAGLLTGGMLVRQARPTPPPPRPPEFAPPGVPWVQQRFLERMRRELDLSPEQTTRLEGIMADSRERVRVLYGLIGPELSAEFRFVRENIEAELNPEQRRRFQELLRPGQRSRPEDDERRFRRGPAPLPNAPYSSPAP